MESSSDDTRASDLLAPDGEVPIDAMRDVYELTPADQLFARPGLPALVGRRVGQNVAALRRPDADDYPAPTAGFDEHWAGLNEVWVYHHRLRGRLPLKQPMQTILTIRDGLVMSIETKPWDPEDGARPTAH